MPTWPWWTHCSGRKNQILNTSTVYLIGVTWGTKDIRGLNTLWESESTLGWRGQSYHGKMPVSVHKVVIKPEMALSSVQFSSFVQSCPTLCNPMNHSTPGFPVHQQTFSVKDQMISISELGSHMAYVATDQLCLSVQKQSFSECKWMDVAVSQQNFIYKIRQWSRFGQWAVICWTVVLPTLALDCFFHLHRSFMVIS